MSDTPQCDTFAAVPMPYITGKAPSQIAAIGWEQFARSIELDLNTTTAELERTKEQLRVAREAIADARNKFSHYATMHFMKDTPEGAAKGRQNELMAEKMSDALKHLAQSNPDKEEPNVSP